MDINLNNKFNEILSEIDKNNKPNLFLHVCCGPCSTSVLKRIIDYFNLYLIFYNSNIDTIIEFNKRYDELLKVCESYNNSIKIIYNSYNHNEFLDYIVGFENEKEGGKRCEKCFELRLLKALEISEEYIKTNNLIDNKNYLCTTLSVSPHKNAEIIERIGEKVCNNSKFLEYLPSDFKKEDGYLNSIKISKELGLYRQNYCGCEFSKMNIS